jgi:hypothetical protein
VPEDSPLNGIGLRIFGIIPETGERFDHWAPAPDGVLQHILGLMEHVEDRESLMRLCESSLKNNLASEWWGQDKITMDWARREGQGSLPYNVCSATRPECDCFGEIISSAESLRRHSSWSCLRDI